MKVWIHVGGTQEGPFELENLPLDRMDLDTPVWFNGMPDWKPAREVPEVACLFQAEESEDECPEQEFPEEQEYPRQQPWGAREQYPGPRVQWMQQGWQQPGPGVPVDENGRPLVCPPNYLVWAIILTVICCNPIGVVAILISSTVKSKFYSGNIEGARRASEQTEWWIAITIVTGLMLSVLGMFIF